MLQKENSGDECDLASTLCKYDLMKGDLLVLNWTRVRRVRSCLCVGKVCAVFCHCLLWLDA